MPARQNGTMNMDRNDGAANPDLPAACASFRLVHFLIVVFIQAREPYCQCYRRRRVQVVSADQRHAIATLLPRVRNFYVAWIRIVQVNVDGSSTELATAYPLMQHVHCEDDAQDWQIVKLNQLPVSWNPHIFDSLCVYLSQPSPLWETWELRDVKLYVLPQESGSGAEESIAATRLGTEAPLKLENASSLGRNGNAAEARLTQLLERRTSRSICNAGMDPGVNSAEQATRCLDLVLRLRELLQYKQE
ncbi:hypothetical protein GQ600_3066 [Phytophthora cactorum]|nr:hypothetical protein GQ600_3066 [Phytophthora cactorum]